MRPLFDSFNVTANALADLILLSGHTLTVGQQSLILAEIYQNVRTVEPAHRAADDVANSVFEFGENQRLLSSTDLHHQGLLGILRGDPSESDWSHLNFQFFPHLRVRFEPAC